MNNDQRFKKGDRVRWTGAFDPTMAWASAVGTTGTVKSDTSKHACTTYVDWDIPDDVRFKRGLGVGIYNGNLELISMIDTTKPLQLDGSVKDITFITETSDGNILVEVGSHGWAIFDRQGKFLRARAGYSCTLDLRNKPISTCEYIAITKSGTPVINNPGYRNRALAWDQNPEADHLVQIDKTDGVVTGVGILKRPLL